MRIGPHLDPAWPVYLPDPVNRRDPLNRGRVALWLPVAPLDGGRQLYDLMGLSPGTLQGGLTWVGSDAGPALAGFAGGSTTYVDCGNGASLNPTGGLTLSAWIRTTKITFDTNGTFAVARDDNTLGRSYAMGVIGGASTNFTLQINGAPTIVAGNWTTLGPGGGSLDNTWVHLLATGDPAGGYRLFCNGAKIGTGAWVAPATTTGKTTLGQRTYSGFQGGLTGRLRSASLWNRGLSDVEATAEWSLSSRGYPGVLNRWRPSVATFAMTGGAVQDIDPTGIASAEAIGNPTLGVGPVSVLPAGIATVEAFGTAILSPGPVSILPAGMASAEAVGSAVLTTGPVAVAPAGIGSTEAFGTATLTTGPVVIAPAGIGPDESFGAAVVSAGGTVLAPVGIGSDESFGVPSLGGAQVVAPQGIAPGEAFGSVTVAGPGAEPGVPLLRAIVDRVLATPGLGDRTTLPGGFVVGKVGDEAFRAAPYGELHEVREGHWYATAPGGLVADDTHLQVEFYGPDPLALKAIQAVWEAAFSPAMAPLAVTGRVHVTCWTLDAFLQADVGRSPAGEPLARQVIEFRVVQAR